MANILGYDKVVTHVLDKLGLGIELKVSKWQPRVIKACLLFAHAFNHIVYGVLNQILQIHQRVLLLLLLSKETITVLGVSLAGIVQLTDHLLMP